MTNTLDTPVSVRLPDRGAAVRRLIGHLRNATTDEWDAIESFEAAEYRDRELARLERDSVFGAVPFIAAHGSELPNPHDFISLRLPRNDVILARQPDGTIKGFVNACRHRGAQVCDVATGNTRVFSCPYHRWAYNVDGTLRTVTLDATFGEFDRSQHGLVEIAVEERHGFVWAIDRAGAEIDAADWLGPEMDTILAGYHIDQLLSITPQRFEHPANWKVMQDGFLDNYHVRYAHPTTAGAVLHTNAIALEDFGRHFWFLAARKSIDRWLDQDPGDNPIEEDVIESCFLAPNTMLLKHTTHIEVLTFRPLGDDPDMSMMELRILAPTRDAAGLSEPEWHARWAKNWRIIISIIHDEDFPILAGSQTAMHSEDTGTMLLGRNELASHLFRREVRRLVAAGAT